MKNLILTIILTIAFCSPLQAELLIFQTRTSGQQFGVEEKVIGKKTEKGYFVIDADLSNSENIVINEAYHLHYEKKATGKTQSTSILDTAEVELILIESGKSVRMLLRYFDDTTGTYLVVYGKASEKSISSGAKRVLASSLSGHAVWREWDFRTGSSDVKFKLNIRACKEANDQGKSAIQVIEEYEQMLAAKGYPVY